MAMAAAVLEWRIRKALRHGGEADGGPRDRQDG
jgi:hypothetical protein